MPDQAIRRARRWGKRRGRAGRRAPLLLVLVLLPALAVPAQAQDANPELPRPGYPLGRFWVVPGVGFENVYDDNIFASDRDEVADYIVSIVPGVAVESAWSRHYLSVSAFGRINRYADVTTEDNDEYWIDAEGRFDLTDESKLGAILGQGRRTLGRANSENTGRIEPEQLDFFEGELSYDHEFARFDLDVRGFVERLDYVDPRDGDKDRTQFGARPRLSHRFSPAFSIFLEPGAEIHDYDQKVDDTGVERSNVTLGAFLGSEFDITSIIKGELAVGPVHVDFDEPSFDEVTTVAVRAEATWDVTALTRLEAGLVRRLKPTRVRGASSKLQTLGSIGVRHELLRNVFLHADGTYFREKFEQLGRTDDNYRIRAGAEYLINRFFSVLAGYRYGVRDSNTPRKDFRKNVVMLTFEARL